MDGQVKLNGLNLNQTTKLMPPSQIINQPTINSELPDITEEIEVKPTPAKLGLDTKNISNIASSAIAGGIGTSAVARDLGTIGESMRSVTVQNAMTEIQDRHYQGSNGQSSYGSGLMNSRSSYNDYNYDADYGATEFVRRRGNGRIEFSHDRRFGQVETDFNSPENRLAASKIASGTLQGAKYGALIGGAVSAVVNTYNVLTGKEKGATAVGKVAADTVTATVSGATGAFAGGLASVGMASMGLAAGIPGLIIATGIGAAGAVGGQWLMTKTGLYDSIVEKVKGMLGSK